MIIIIFLMMMLFYLLENIGINDVFVIGKFFVIWLLWLNEDNLLMMIVVMKKVFSFILRIVVIKWKLFFMDYNSDSFD